MRPRERRIQTVLAGAACLLALVAFSGTAAAQSPPDSAGAVRGRVTAEATGEPVTGARVRVETPAGSRVARTDTAGAFELTALPAGARPLEVRARGYAPERVTARVPAGGVVRLGLRLAPAEEEVQGATVRGRVVAQGTDEPLADVAVQIEGTGLGVFTDSAGRYRITGVPPGPQVLRASRIGYGTARLSLTLAPEETVRRRIELARTALKMEEIRVTADVMGRAEGELATATVISEEAIENQAATSLAGLLSQVPGVEMKPPGLGGVQQFGLRAVATPGLVSGTLNQLARGVSASQLASFGTQVVLDGVPLSNNANLQTLGPRGEFGMSIPSAAGGGVDLRRIPASTLERVEVIRGVPSVRYSDLTQGAVIVYTKAGEVAPEMTGQFDPRTTSGAAYGGTSLGPDQTGTLTTDVTRTLLLPGIRDEVGSRVAGQLAHRLRLGEEGGAGTLDTRLDFFQLIQDHPLQPEIQPGFRERNRNRGLRLSERLRLEGEGGRRYRVTSAVSLTQQRSFTQNLLIRGALPFTDRTTEGRQRGHYVLGNYRSHVEVNGTPGQWFTRLEAEDRADALGLEHRLRLGAVLRREWNEGAGRQFPIERPPQVSFNGVQGYDRPRSYEQIPAMAASGLYLDDRMRTVFAGGSMRLSLQAGLRVDLLHEGGWWASGARDAVFQPRGTAIFSPTPGLRLRVGAGRTAKLPSMADLYPAPQYFDVVNVNHFADDPAERLAVLTTKIRDPSNPDLGFSAGEKWEAGVEVDLGRDAAVTATAFRNVVEGGVGTRFTPSSLTREHLALAETPPGQPPEPVGVASTDTVPILIHRPANNLRLENRGLEVTAFLPEIQPLRTQLQVQGAWIETDFTKAGLDFGTQDLWTDFQLDADQRRSPYWEAPTGHGERAIATYRAVHHQPELGLVITGIVQHYLHESERVEAATDTLAFEGYVTRDGELHPVPRSERSAPRYRDLRRTRSGVLTRPQALPADWIMSLRVSKTLPLGGRLSFYVFNALHREGKQALLNRRIFPDPRFGLQARLPLGEVF